MPFPEDLRHLVEASCADVRALLEALSRDPQSKNTARLCDVLHDRAFRLIREGTRGEIVAEFELLTQAASDFQGTDLELAIELKTLASQLKRALADAPADETPATIDKNADRERRREVLRESIVFEKDVAEVFRLLGYRTIIDYKRDDMQFDVRCEMPGGLVPSYVLIECKDFSRPVGQREIREFASKVEHARVADQVNYQAVLVGRSGFVNNAHAVARKQRVELRTYRELLLSLVDFEPALDDAVRGFTGTDLEKVYVEQDVVLQSSIHPGNVVRTKPLTEAVRAWIRRDNSTLLTLLGDFGSGKSSFCRRFACELAQGFRQESGTRPSRPTQADATYRLPLLVDLREGGSTTVTLENLLMHHLQRLTSQPVLPQALLHLSREGHLVLFFDGFDEILGYSEPSRFLDNLRQILRAADGRAKVILTCRTHYFRDRPDEARQLGRASEILTTTGATQLYEAIRERPEKEQIDYEVRTALFLNRDADGNYI